MCYLDENNQFVKVMDIDVKRAVEEAAGISVVNNFEHVGCRRLVCVHCAGALHHEEYVTSENKVGARFLRKARQSLA